MGRILTVHHISEIRCQFNDTSARKIYNYTINYSRKFGCSTGKTAIWPRVRSDLNDKKRLTDALAQERESYAQLESDFQVLVIFIKKLKIELNL